MFYYILVKKSDEVEENDLLNFKTKENYFQSTLLRKKISKKNYSIVKKSLNVDRETINHYIEKCEKVYFFFNEVNRSTRILRRIVAFHKDKVIMIYIFKNLEEKNIFLKHAQ